MRYEKPVEGLLYYYISLVDGQGVVLRKEHKNRNIDYLNCAVGNCFTTYKEAEKAMPKYIDFLKERSLNPVQAWRESNDNP